MPIPAYESAPPDYPVRPGARKALLILLGINLFNYIDRYVLAAVEPLASKDLLPSDPNALTKMGSLVTVFTISYMITAPLFGWLADRTSRWLLIAIGVAVWTLASGGSGLAKTFTMLLLTRIFIGIGEASYGPAAPTLIAEYYPVARRGNVMAWFYMAIPVGSAIGYAIGGVISQSFGWRWAFYAVVPPGLLLAALCLFMKEPNKESKASKKAARATFADYKQIFLTPSYVLDCAGMTAMTFAIGGIAFWMPRYISETRKAGDLAHVNTIFGIITVITGITATLLGGIAGDKLRGRFPGSYFIVSGIAIFIACPCILLMLVIPFPAAWVAIGFAEFFLFFNTGPSNTILANVTRPSVRATAFALNILIIHALGDALSPPLLGAIAEKFSWDAAFILVTATMGIAGITWLWGARYLARDTERAAA